MEEKTLSDYIDAFKRHLKSFLWIFSVVAAIAVAVAILLPPTYRSMATILIEEQEIPPDLVRSTITSFATQRLQVISQRVMTRANLLKIIDKFNLYAKEREKQTTEEVTAQMRKDIQLDTISADVIDPRSGHPTQATIAFTLAFDGRNPDLVQRVANEITSLYLEENLKNRTEKTEETSDFIQAEVSKVGEQVSQLEKQVADFKQENINALPEQKELNREFMHRTESEIDDIATQLRLLEDRKLYLEGELAQIKPDTPIISSTGERVFSPEDRLKQLQSLYASISATHSEKHPDVVKMRQEIESLQQRVGSADSALDQAKRLEQLQNQLAEARQRYSETHPDVVSLRKQVETLQAEVGRSATQQIERKIGVTQPENPAYITLKTQLDTTVQDIRSYQQRRQELRTKLAEYEARLSKTPELERQYSSLLRDYENAAIRYKELKAKEMEAKIAQELEKKSKGERFSLIEPAVLPEKPIKPNRLAIVVLGFVLAVGAGGGYIFLRESLDKSVRGLKRLALLVGEPPLAAIPYIPLDVDITASHRLRWIVLGIALLVIVAGVLFVHLVIGPLDVLWFRGLRKLDQMT